MQLKNAAFAIVEPTECSLSGQVVLPGSKSVTNRALLLAALARGTSELKNILDSDDTHYMTLALRDMGVKIVKDTEQNVVRVHGTGELSKPKNALFLGNAGTAMRFLAGAAALVDGEVTLDGDEYMRKRPIGPLAKALANLGFLVKVEGGCPPLSVTGGKDFKTTKLEIDAGMSSQYVSAIMMMAGAAKTQLDLTMPTPDIGGRGYIDITIRLMQEFGNEVDEISRGHWLINPTGYQNRDYTIEPDASAATYMWGLSAVTGGNIELGVSPNDMVQPDAKAFDIIERFPNFPEEVDGRQIQDSIPTLAVLAAFSGRNVRFTGLENIRIKECDRVMAIYQGINSMHEGAAKIEGDDLIVLGESFDRNLEAVAEIETYDDHRIAMAFSIAGVKRRNVKIKNPWCVAKTFPNYWNCLQNLGISVRFY
jgi:3-phosphoshikimate 1-carboxyvinyltransferase